MRYLVTLCTVLLLAATAHAEPFFVQWQGDALRCGSFVLEDGAYKVRNCKPLYSLVKGPLPTPTPILPPPVATVTTTPKPTTTPAVPVCEKGEIPDAAHATYPPGTRGVTKVQLQKGATHTYCLTVDKATTGVTASLASEGASQCLWVDLALIPPPGYSPPYGEEIGTGRDVSVGVFDIEAVPRETWRIQVVDHSDCVQPPSYQLFAVY